MTADELLERLKARDPDAQVHFRKYVRTHLLAICMRELRDRTSAEDIVEDVLTDFIFDHVDRLRSPRAVHRYLRVTAIRRCRRHRTLAARHATLREETMSRPYSAREMVAALDQPRRQARLAHCMSRLTTRARQVLRMKFHNEMTNAAIGSTFGFSGQYASRIIGKALTTLRRCMEPVA